MPKKQKFRAFQGRVFAIMFTLLLGMQTASAGNGQVTLTVKNPNPYVGNHSWFIYEQSAGNTIQDIVTLKNFGDEPETVNIYAVDATSSETGSFILKFLEEEQKTIGVWTTLETKSTVIPAHGSTDIPFTINIPKGVSPGQYTGGIVVETQGSGNTDASEENAYCEANDLCGGSINVKTRIGSRIYLTIPGSVSGEINLASLKAEKGITGITKFEFTIQNGSNISYEPRALIEIFDSMGKPYERIEKVLGTAAPGTTIKPIVRMSKRPIIGSFRAQATVEFHSQFAEEKSMHGSAITQTQKVNFWVMPWEIIFGALFIFFAWLGYHAVQQKKKRDWLEKSEAYTVQLGDNLVDLAQKYSIGWEKIAKLNRIKAPYILKQGDIIRIPKYPPSNAKK